MHTAQRVVHTAQRVATQPLSYGGGIELSRIKTVFVYLLVKKVPSGYKISLASPLTSCDVMISRYCDETGPARNLKLKIVQ